MTTKEGVQDGKEEKWREGGKERGRNISSRCRSGNTSGDVLSPFLLTKAKWSFLEHSYIILCQNVKMQAVII